MLPALLDLEPEAADALLRLVAVCSTQNPHLALAAADAAGGGGGGGGGSKKAAALKQAQGATAAFATSFAERLRDESWLTAMDKSGALGADSPRRRRTGGAETPPPVEPPAIISAPEMAEQPEEAEADAAAEAAAAAAAAAAAREVRRGWSGHVDPASGVAYYHNAVTGQSTWQRPPQLMHSQRWSAGDGLQQSLSGLSAASAYASASASASSLHSRAGAAATPTASATCCVRLTPTPTPTPTPSRWRCHDSSSATHGLGRAAWLGLGPRALGLHSHDLLQAARPPRHRTARGRLAGTRCRCRAPTTERRAADDRLDEAGPGQPQQGRQQWPAAGGRGAARWQAPQRAARLLRAPRG